LHNVEKLTGEIIIHSYLHLKSF